MLSEHQLLLFWTQLFALLVVARALGSLARRFGQPAVVGELGAGLLLGPSVLGALAPGAFFWLFPADPVQRGLLSALAWIGVFFLLVDTGFEIDLGLVRRLGAATLRIAIGSLVLPVLAGIGIGFVLPGRFIGASDDRVVFALFMGTALGISALPVIAKILSDLDLMRRNIAQVTITAAMANDVAGWVLLGVVAGLARSGSFDAGALALTLAGLALFCVVAATLGQRAVDQLLRRARARRSVISSQIALVLLITLAFGIVTQALGIEAVLGAFVAGILIGRSRYQESEVFDRLRAVTSAIFAPLFFASAGLRVDLALLDDPDVIGWGLLVLAVASLSKFLGSYAGARGAGFARIEGLAIGAGLNARGAVEIVIATVGLTLGVLNERSYTVIVLMAIATSMMAPPILRALLHRWPGSDEEQRRLEQERRLGGNVLLRPARLLLPSHGGPNSILAAQIVDQVWPSDQEVTVLSAGRDVPPDDLARVLAVFSNRPVVHEHAATKLPLDAILEHAGLGYGAIAVGATDLAIEGRLASPIVDDLLAQSPIPLIMVRRGSRDAAAGARHWRRILVPATGTRTGRAALEVACAVARANDAELVLAHIVTSPDEADRLLDPADEANEIEPHEASFGEGADLRLEIAERVLADARTLAFEFGVRLRTEIRRARAAPEALLALATEHDVDLVVLTANVRQLSGRPFLGHGVEYLLARSASTVIVVTAPAGRTL